MLLVFGFEPFAIAFFANTRVDGESIARQVHRNGMTDAGRCTCY